MWRKIIFVMVSLIIIALTLTYYSNIKMRVSGLAPKPVDWWLDIYVYGVGYGENASELEMFAAVNARVLVIGFDYTGEYDDGEWINGATRTILLGSATAEAMYENGSIKARAHVEFTYPRPPTFYKFPILVVALWGGSLVVENNSKYYLFNGTWGGLYYTIYYTGNATLDNYMSVEEYIERLNDIELEYWNNHTTGFPRYDEKLRSLAERYGKKFTFAISSHEVNIYAVYPLNYTEIASPEPYTSNRKPGSLPPADTRFTGHGDSYCSEYHMGSKYLYYYPVFLHELHVAPQADVEYDISVEAVASAKHEWSSAISANIGGNKIIKMKSTGSYKKNFTIIGEVMGTLYSGYSTYYFYRTLHVEVVKYAVDLGWDVESVPVCEEVTLYIIYFSPYEGVASGISSSRCYELYKGWEAPWLSMDHEELYKGTDLRATSLYVRVRYSEWRTFEVTAAVKRLEITWQNSLNVESERFISLTPKWYDTNESKNWRVFMTGLPFFHSSVDVTCPFGFPHIDIKRVTYSTPHEGGEGSHIWLVALWYIIKP